MMKRLRGCLTFLCIFGCIINCSGHIHRRPDVGDTKEDEAMAKLATVTPGVSDGSSFKYHDYVGLTGFLNNTATRFSNIVRVFSIGKSVQGDFDTPVKLFDAIFLFVVVCFIISLLLLVIRPGRELWMTRITNNPDIEEGTNRVTCLPLSMLQPTFNFIYLFILLRLWGFPAHDS
jgi:hypothetical protein